MNHVDGVVDVSKSAGTAFGALDFTVDVLPYCVGGVRFQTVDAFRAVRSAFVLAPVAHRRF
ncbi:hypothetical protein [Verminephrobacter eiseniae]|uniref:hypothetical protein n=1 Tax=Verminephrobacter eiseniae TaxID=364317 RepID=UPI0022381801|nr:hypothetical protein [Verminephrobacter eiseniae]